MNKQYYIKSVYNNKVVIVVLKIRFTSFITISIENLKKWPTNKIIKAGRTENRCKKLIQLYHDRFYMDRSLSNTEIISYSELLELLNKN